MPPERPRATRSSSTPQSAQDIGFVPRMQAGIDTADAVSAPKLDFTPLKQDLSTFADEVIRWQSSHGRHSLPWQASRDPYPVWLSEIMLQQTQVATVLEYYGRFLRRFPSVADLAAASHDDVLALWSGLGYYSRARNLHRCAQDIVNLHAGKFPGTAAELETLPGIGRSTAAAISSFCFSERVAILDGNVKRVLTRVLGFSGDLAKGAEERALWEKATKMLPNKNLNIAMPHYTQGLMDIGATICSRRQPKCMVCPIQAMCCGRAGGNPEAFPVKTRTLKRSEISLTLLLATKRDGSCWLEKRPLTGIWGGLYCLPVFKSDDDLKASLTPSSNRPEQLSRILHVLTHRDLYLLPWRADFEARESSPFARASSADSGDWYLPTQWAALGLPAPIRKLLDRQGSR